MENDLISRSALKEILSTLTMTITGLRAGKGVLNEFMTEYRNSVLRIVDDAPALDAVDVVRCKDCKHTDTDGCGAIYCEKWDRWEIPEDFFCSYGERRADDD